jgi:hypothetical protein
MRSDVVAEIADQAVNVVTEIGLGEHVSPPRHKREWSTASTVVLWRQP